MIKRISWAWCWCAIALPLAVRAQSSPELQQVLTRLDRLENQNRELLDELRSLRQQLAAVAPAASPPAATADVQPLPAAPLEERVEVQEQRIAQMEQSNVSTEHKLPVTLTGMALFNAFMNGRGSGGADNPVTASATLRQADGGA